MTDKAKRIVDMLRAYKAHCEVCSCDGVDTECRLVNCRNRLGLDAAGLIERLQEELERVKRERNAAIYDIGKLCKTCKYNSTERSYSPCNNCFDDDESRYEWRGVCAENSKDGAE